MMLNSSSKNCFKQINPSWLVSAFIVLFPSLLSAHEAGGEAAGLAEGFMHPISGLDHVLAMVAVGLWGAQLGAPALWLLPVAFPLVMAIGGFLGLIGVPIPGIEMGIAASAIALGVLVALEAKLPLVLAVVVVGFFAVFHGHAHGTELPEGENAALYSIGFVISTGCLHGVGILLGLIHKWQIGAVIIRVAGVAVAAGGGYFLWRALA